MTDTSFEEADSSLDMIRENSGIMSGSEKDLQSIDEIEAAEKAEVEPEEEPEIKPEEGDDKGTEADKDKEAEDKPSPQSRKARPANQGPLGAAFAQINDLTKIVTENNKLIADLATQIAAKPASQEVAPAEGQTKAQGAVTDAVNELSAKLAEKHGQDTEVVADLASGILAIVEKLTPKEAANLPQDVQDKLKLIDDLTARENERKVAEAKAETVLAYDGEWNEFRTELRKQYPNANDQQINDMKGIMYDVAHSEKGGVVIDADKHIIQAYPLSYLLFQNVDGIRSKFDTVLTVAPKRQGAERTGSKDIREKAYEEPDDDGAFNIEDMTPAKMKQRQDARIESNAKDRSGDVHAMG